MTDANTPATPAAQAYAGAHAVADRRTGPGRRMSPADRDLAARFDQVQAIAHLERQVAMLSKEVLKCKDVCRGCAGFSGYSDHD